LKEYAGITREQVTGKVDYKKSGKQQTDIKSEGAETITSGVSDVRKKTGEKNGKAWTAYTVVCGELEYKTFSETIAKTAKEARDAGLQVELTFKNLSTETILRQSKRSNRQKDNQDRKANYDSRKSH